MIMARKTPGREWESLCCYDPITMVGLATASAVVTSGASLFGSLQSADAQAASAAYQAQVARNNQTIAEQNATEAQDVGLVREQAQRQNTASLIGSQRAMLAGAGLDVNSGSPLDVQSDSAKLGELNAQTIRHNAALEAYGYQTQASNFSAQSQLYDARSAWASATGYTNLLGNAIGDGLSFTNKLMF